jgi:hypothetical protein
LRHAMKVRTLALLSLFLAGSQLSSGPVAAASLSYEPVVVELAGRVVLEEHFGPPGFGKDPKTDLKGLLAFLILDEPVSVEGDPGDAINQTRTDVRRVQLVSTDIRFLRYEGARVAVSGTLFGRHTGHHYADVLIFVEMLDVRQ